MAAETSASNGIKHQHHGEMAAAAAKIKRMAASAKINGGEKASKG